MSFFKDNAKYIHQDSTIKNEVVITIFMKYKTNNDSYYVHFKEEVANLQHSQFSQEINTKFRGWFFWECLPSINIRSFIISELISYWSKDEGRLAAENRSFPESFIHKTGATMMTLNHKPWTTENHRKENELRCGESNMPPPHSTE